MSVQRTYQLKRQYGLTDAEYERMFVAQAGVCAVCHQPESDRSRGGRVKKLAVDHDHRTGKIRSLLCRRCNTIQGLAKDNPVLLIELAGHLAMHSDMVTA